MKIYTEPNYPSCLLDEPIGCNGNYLLALRPDTDTAGSTIKGTIPANYFTAPGPLTLHAALSYSDHNPYPTEQAVIHESIPIKLVE